MKDEDSARRNELTYLVLYYAIIGNEDKADVIRRVVDRLESKEANEDEKEI